MWPFSSLRRPTSPVGQVGISQGSFDFRGNPGHDYDTWSWPHPPASNQYTFFHAIPGNVLPSTYKFIQSHETLEQVQPAWMMPTSAEQTNIWQRLGSGNQVLRFGQNQSARYAAQQSANWQTLYYNGGVS